MTAIVGGTMRLRCLAIAVAVPAFTPLTEPLTAQQPLRVVRHAPVDTARPSQSITISFDRPVGGSVDRTPDPRRILRVTPALDARLEWRDPVTLRIVPRAPLAPGSRYQVTLSNDFAAMDGGRLGAPYSFTIRTKGPALVASIPGLGLHQRPELEPNGRLRLLYSAPLDSAAFSAPARIELEGNGTSCPRRTVRYAVRSIREVLPTDDPQILYAGYTGDSAERSYRRLVEMHPVAPLPPACAGAVVLASLDPSDQPEIRYRVTTARLFALETPYCDPADCVAAGYITVRFTAPVHRDSLRKHLRIEPAVPFVVSAGNEDLAQSWTVRLRLTPRTRYTIRVDSTLTDAFRRRLTGRRSDTLRTGDRQPAIGHAAGFATASRVQRTFRVRYVNVDTIELQITRIPQRLRVAALQASANHDSIVRLVGRLGAPVRHRVAVTSTPFNVERITDIRLPAGVLGAPGGSSLLAIRARAVARTRPREQNGIVEIEAAPPVDAKEVVDMRPYALMQFTDLVTHAKVSDDGGAVFVLNGSTGKPVAGARVTARDTLDRVLALGVTDSTGVAALTPTGVRPATGPQPGSRRYPDYENMRRDVRIVEVVRAEDQALTIVSANPQWDHPESVMRLGGHESPPKQWRAAVSTDRQIYRPGEKIYLTGIVRRGPLDNLQTPELGDSVRVRMLRVYPGEYEPRTVREWHLRTTRFGTVADSFSLPQAAPLGDYSVSISGPAASSDAAGSAWFRLAEYRAPEFETTVALDTGVRFLGDSITVYVGGRYYFGAPMAGAAFRWTKATIDYQGGWLAGLPPGFVVGATSGVGPNRQGRSEWTSGVDTLDSSGKLAFRLPTTLGSSTTPAMVHVSVGVDDVNRQAVSASGSILMHSSSYYIAVRDGDQQGWYWRAGVPRRFEVIAARPDGRRVPGVRVRVAVVRHQRTPVIGDDGSAPRWTSTIDTVRRDVVVTRDSIIDYTFSPPGEGSYEIVFTGTDDGARPLRTVVGGHVGRQTWATGNDNPLALPLEVDSVTLVPGDTLTVRFTSPFRRAEAWVTAEREDMLAQRRLVAVQGENVVRIPVTPAFIPSAEISVVLAETTPIWRTDSAHHRFRAGYGRIDVSRESKMLAVAVDPEAARYAPGDSARVRVSVRDHRGRPVIAHLTVWAVDQGVLAMTGGGTPNVTDQIFSSYGTALRFGTNAMTVARQAQLRRLDDLMEIRRLSFDGSGVAGAPAYGLAAASPAMRLGVALSDAPRSDFRSTAFYVASLVTDAGGRAVATVKLPDNVTAYRVVAVATTAGDSFGSGDSTITLSRPLIARPSLPRFLRAGDSILAGAAVNNTTSSPLATRVTASGERLGFASDMTATRSLAAGATAEVRFDWRSNGEPGDTALFRFSVTGGDHADAVESKIPIRAPYAPRFHAVSGVARGPTSVRMMLPADIDPRRSRLTLRVGTSPVPLVRAAYAWVDVYPFHCSEQLASTGQVILSVLRLQRAGLLDSTQTPTAAMLRARLQFVIDELARRQDFFGGIGYWSATSWSSRWLSAYAGQLMVDARSIGFRVDSVVVNKIARYTQFEPDTVAVIPGIRYGTRAERARDVAHGLADDLAVLHFLRAAGNADTVRENQMVQRAPEMVWEDRVWLAELLAGRRNPAAARAQLGRVWRDVERAGVRVDIPDSLVRTLGFRSHVRPAVRLLTATLAADPDHPSLASLVERIVQLGRAEQHAMWNTQDYAVLSSAMADLAIAQRRSPMSGPITVRAGGADRRRVVLAGSASGSTDGAVSLDGLLQRDGEWMALPLEIDGGGTDPAFYVLTVDEVPLTPPTTPDVKGITVERWFERFDDARPVTEVVEGDLVRGRLRITVPTDREFVAVADLLPAGLELIDVTLRTSSIGPFRSEASDDAMRAGNRANLGSSSAPWLYGSWRGGWWTPWEHEEKRDDRVTYFARVLWKGTYTATYVARATTVGTFVHPPAHAEEMYNPSVGGRSDGGTFRVLPRR